MAQQVNPDPEINQNFLKMMEAVNKTNTDLATAFSELEHPKKVPWYGRFISMLKNENPKYQNQEPIKSIKENLPLLLRRSVETDDAFFSILMGTKVQKENVEAFKDTVLKKQKQLWGDIDQTIQRLGNDKLGKDFDEWKTLSSQMTKDLVKAEMAMDSFFALQQKFNTLQEKKGENSSDRIAFLKELPSLFKEAEELTSTWKAALLERNGTKSKIESKAEEHLGHLVGNFQKLLEDIDIGKKEPHVINESRVSLSKVLEELSSMKSPPMVGIIEKAKEEFLALQSKSPDTIAKSIEASKAGLERNKALLLVLESSKESLEKELQQATALFDEKKQIYTSKKNQATVAEFAVKKNSEAAKILQPILAVEDQIQKARETISSLDKEIARLKVLIPNERKADEAKDAQWEREHPIKNLTTLNKDLLRLKERKSQLGQYEPRQKMIGTNLSKQLPFVKSVNKSLCEKLRDKEDALLEQIKTHNQAADSQIDIEKVTAEAEKWLEVQEKIENKASESQEIEETIKATQEAISQIKGGSPPSSKISRAQFSEYQSLLSGLYNFIKTKEISSKPEEISSRNLPNSVSAPIRNQIEKLINLRDASPVHRDPQLKQYAVRLVVDEEREIKLERNLAAWEAQKQTTQERKREWKNWLNKITKDKEATELLKEVGSLEENRNDKQAAMDEAQREIDEIRKDIADRERQIEEYNELKSQVSQWGL